MATRKEGQPLLLWENNIKGKGFTVLDVTSKRKEWGRRRDKTSDNPKSTKSIE